MTAKDKVTEAEYNFEKLKQAHSDQEFRILLSNFLSSCYGIMQHLLEDMRIKFNYELDYLTIKTFRDQANKTQNSDAIKFIKWYDAEQQALRNNKSYGFLWKKRNQSVHTSSVMPENKINLEIGITPTFVDEKTGESSLGERKVQNRAWNFFNENKKDNTFVVCTNFLNHIKKIVNDSEKL